MKKGHTKGEWVFLRGGVEVQSETNNHEIYCYVGEHPVAIASVLTSLESEHDDDHYSMSEEEGLANARIIAAAPKMLEALRCLLKAARLDLRNDDWAILCAKTAIYKATGEDC